VTNSADYPSEALARLNALSGVWQTRIAMLDSNAREVEHFSATDTYRWLAGRHFMLHEVDAMMDGQHVQSLEVIGLDHPTGTYRSRNFDNAGAISDYTATMDGSAWSIDGAAERFRGRFNADGNLLSGRWDRLVGERWLPWMVVTLTRTGTA
jgi:hypothetical protein